MELKETQANWELLARQDALYGVLSHPGKEGGRWSEEEFFATGQAEIAGAIGELERLSPGTARHKALDFGCGVGRLTQALAGHFEEVTGLDISPAMLGLAEKHNKYGLRCRFLLNEKGDLSLFGSGAFDFIYSNIVLQHMAPEYALGYVFEFARVLAPGGAACFQLPQRRGDSALRRALKRATPRPLLRLYRRLRYGAAATQADIEMNGVPEPEVLATLKRAGLKVLKHGGGWYWSYKEPS